MSAQSKSLCKYNCRCIPDTSIEEITALRKEFWGGAFDTPPNPSRRKKQLERIIADAHDRVTNTFLFRVGTRAICERALLLLLGLVGNHGRPPRQWRDAIQSFKDGSFYSRGDNPKKDATDVELKRLKSDQTKKSSHAKSYIQWLALIFADTSPTDSKVKILPYENVQQMHEEYIAFCRSQGIHVSLHCSYETFRVAFNSLHEEVRLRRAKGSFPTCDICNNANDLLRSGKGNFSKARHSQV